MKELLRKNLIDYAKDYLRKYHININKYIFGAHMNEDSVTAYVEARLNGTKLRIFIDNIYFNENTGKILQSSRPSFE